MMNRITFGTTWASQQFLTILEEVDAGRLKRGKTYANNGSILSVEYDIRNKKFILKVYGGEEHPYTVKISMTSISLSKSEPFFKALLEDEGLLEDLQQGKYFEEHEDLANEYGIGFLPLEYNTLKTSCTCYDSWTTCKHQVAAVYEISRRIDNDVSVLFALSGIDLRKELQYAKVMVSTPQEKLKPIDFVWIMRESDPFSLDLAIYNPENLSEPPEYVAYLIPEKKKYYRRPINEFLEKCFNISYFLSRITAPLYSISFGFDDLEYMLFYIIPSLQSEGIKVFLPKSFDELKKLSITGSVSSSKEGSFFNMENLLSFEWKVAVGDKTLTDRDLEKLVESTTNIIKFNEQYVYIDRDELLRLHQKIKNPDKMKAHDFLKMGLSEEYAGFKVDLDDTTQALIKKLTQDDTVPLPKSLQATLRPYQERGYNWLYKNLKLGFGSIIADDMGLGKTLQVITLIAKLKEQGELKHGKVLVVLPTSLLMNWQREVQRFTPDLTTSIFHGSTKTLPLAEDMPDIFLTTYGLIRRNSEALNAYQWRLVVIDEAQNIKNHNTAQTKALKTIECNSFIAMSGTPVENRLSEYWGIMDCVNRGYLGGITQFKREFATPIQTHQDEDALRIFRKVTSPFILRRLKSDKTIINDLPDKIEQDQYCSLTKEQVALYESVVRKSIKAIEGEDEEFERQGLILQMILQLKQICNHPAHFVKSVDAEPSLSGKAERLITLLEGIDEQNEKVLIFTQFTEMADILSTWMEKRYHKKPLLLTGKTSVKKRSEMVDAFQNDPEQRIFILSIKAGGTGLNLTAASHVVHYDLWWNPAVESQATDRAYRIGQHRNVQVHRLITQATFEEVINEMIQKKKHLADLTVGTGEQWIGNLSTKEIQEIFTLRK